MLQEFFTNINNNSLFNKNDLLLVAISGGIDSVVLADLLNKHHFKWTIAHCNFSLRGKDSDDDEKFVLSLSSKYSVQCFSIKWNTLEYAQKYGLSIQMAARNLRYQWFEELMKIYSFDYLLTAHHMDDNIETILLNQIRSTGIRGLAGIPIKQNKIVRPLLYFTKEKILDYAHKNQLKYREDSSNQEDKYQRNYIRHHIIPHLKKLQPQLYSVFQNNIHHLNKASKFINDTVNSLMSSIVSKENDFIKIHKDKLYHIPHLHFVLQYYLSQFNFNPEQITDIANSFSNKLSGKCYYSLTHILLFDREYIFIATQNNQNNNNKEYIAHNLTELNLYSDKIYFEIIINNQNINLKDKKAFYVSIDNISFPLKLRHKRDGDRFQLLGTNYEKKISDILIDKKVPFIVKDKIILLTTTHDEVLWISHLNLINEKHKIISNTHKILKITTCE